MLTTREAAELLRLQPPAILARRKAGTLPSAGHNGKTYLFSEEVVTKHMQGSSPVNVDRVNAILKRRFAS